MDIVGDFDDVVSYLCYCLFIGGFFLGFIFDYLVGIGWGLLDVGLLSLRGRYNYIYLIYIGKGIFEKYFGVQYKKYKFDIYYNKGYKDSISYKYDIY